MSEEMAPEPAATMEAPKKDFSYWAKKVWRFTLKTVKYFLIISIGMVVVTKFVPIFFTPLMVMRKVEAWMDGKDATIHYQWKSYDEVSRNMHLAVVASEDQNFPNHFGLDWDAIMDAQQDNKKRKIKRGASTISQQVAKNVFLFPQRSYIRKGLEVYFTFLIEVIWGKERILEVYVNIAEMGNMTFGAEAAGQRFFKTSAAKLNASQAATLAAVLPNPRRMSAARPSNYVAGRREDITEQMRMLGGTDYIKGLRSF